MHASPNVVLAKPEDTAFVTLYVLNSENHTIQEIPSILESNTNHAAICYVAVSDGERLTVQWEFTNAEPQYVDLIVDGILRNSSFERRSLKKNKGEFVRALHKTTLETGKKSKLLTCNLVVEARDNTKGIYGVQSLIALSHS